MVSAAGDRPIVQKRFKDAGAIHRNPEAVKAIKKEARENEDLATKTAVLNKIKADKAEKQRDEYREHGRPAYFALRVLR